MLINARHCVHHSLHWKSGSDKTHRSGSDDADPESVGFLDEFLCLVLWYTLSYDGYNTELREREAVCGIGMYAEAVCTQTLVHCTLQAVTVYKVRPSYGASIACEGGSSSIDYKCK